MKTLKGILEEELARSKRMKESYDRELAKLPKGSLVVKTIHKNRYYYLIYRDKEGKNRSEYKGIVAAAELEKYKEAKKLRAKYRSLRAEVRRQIQTLEKMLRLRAMTKPNQPS